MRLIDAHRLIEELNEAQVEGDELYKGLGKAKVIVCYQPTIDAVPIVRCKDCKYRIQEQTVPFSTTDPQCVWFRIYRNPNGYCHLGERKYSYGERRTDDNY